MNSICFLSQFPPPVHGLSKAVETLYESKLKTKYNFTKIDITNNKSMLWTLWKLLITKADTIYFTISQTIGGNWRDLLFLKIIFLRKKKCIVHLHGGYYRTLVDKDMKPFQHRLNENAMNKVDGAIVLGDSLHWIFERLVPDDKIYTVRNCMDDQFCINDIKTKVDNIVIQDKIHVLYLSNFIASKGYPIVLEVANLIIKRGKSDKFVFHFAGKFLDQYPTEEQKFHRFVAKNGLESFVILHGPTYGREKVELLEKCNVFMLPTTYPKEGQPISILEAMGNGMAIVTTDHAGIPDIATTNNGFISHKNNIEINAIADYLEKCYNDREYLKTVSEKNYQTVMTEFTEKAYINNMEKVFDGICTND